MTRPFEYTLKTIEISGVGDIASIPDLFSSAYYLKHVTLKNMLENQLKAHDSVLLHLVLPKSGKCAGWFVTTKDKAYLDFHYRFNLHHCSQVRKTAFDYCGHFAEFQ